MSNSSLLIRQTQFDLSCHRRGVRLSVGEKCHYTHADIVISERFSTMTNIVETTEVDNVIDNILAHLSEVIRIEHNIPRKEALQVVVDSLLDQRHK